MNAEVHDTDVLVVGGGAAGMYAAAEARRAGARVTLVDKSLVGRGGATVMAQMTVAAALGHAEPDSWVEHYEDTVTSGRGLTDELLAALLCHDAPRRILESWERGVNWERDGDGLAQVLAPGHRRARCCYVGSLQTGHGVVRGLRKELRRQQVTGVDTTMVTDLIRDGDRVVGAAALDVKRGEPVAIWAPAVILACGGLTEAFARNSASYNMTGDAYGLALRAGADLIDMEMVQFFPIANLAPRTVGLDPIMWDPFRYRLGGRLLNGDGREFLETYTGVADEGTYTASRDMVTYAILEEVAAGRGSPNGGVYLDFTDLTLETMREAFPTAIDRLLEQGIDISRRPVEVAPTAHYTIGGVTVDVDLRTSVEGLFAAGEAVGGQHGANRLSGNAISEAFVYGARAGQVAARHARAVGHGRSATASQAMDSATGEVAGVRGRCRDSGVFLPALRAELQQLMWTHVGPLRDADGLEQTRQQLGALRRALHEDARVDARHSFNLEWAEWFALRNLLDSSEAVRLSAASRLESRGAHQRRDHATADDRFRAHAVTSRGSDGTLVLTWRPPRSLDGEPQAWSPPEPLATPTAGADP